MSMDSTIGPWVPPPDYATHGSDSPLLQNMQDAAKTKFLNAWVETQREAKVGPQLLESQVNRPSFDKRAWDDAVKAENPTGDFDLPSKEFYKNHPVPHDSNGNWGWAQGNVEFPDEGLMTMTPSGPKAIGPIGNGKVGI